MERRCGDRVAKETKECLDRSKCWTRFTSRRLQAQQLSEFSAPNELLWLLGLGSAF